MASGLDPNIYNAALQGDPNAVATLTQLINGPAPQPVQGPAPLPHQGIGQNVLQSLSGLEQQNYGPPQSFGMGLLGGFAHGLGSAGTRAAAQRAKLEADVQRRQALADLANQRATEQYRQGGTEARKAITTAMLTQAGNQAKEADKQITLTPEQIAQAPAGSVAATFKPGTAMSRATYESALTKDAPKSLTQIRQEAQARAQGEAAGIPTTGANADQQFAEMARQYVYTGTFPRNLLGKGEQQAFRDYVHANYPNANIPKNAAQYNADKSSLTNQQKNYDTVSTLNNTLTNSIQTLRGVMSEVPDTGLPLFNGVARFGAKMLGNTSVPDFDQALHVVRNETGKILGGNFAGGGTLLDSEKKDMRAVQSGSYTRDQLAHVIDIVESDKIGRLNAGRKQVNKIKARLDFAEGNGQTPQDTAWYGTISGSGNKLSVADPDGKVHAFASRHAANNFIESVNQTLGY